MKIYKFGGASVKDAVGIRNLEKIVSDENGQLVIVVSAFGKTTNALEQVLKSRMNRNGDHAQLLNNIYDYHISVVKDLFPVNHNVFGKIANSFAVLREYLNGQTIKEYDFEYDQIVSNGEVWSTMIVAEFLSLQIKTVKWIDIRGVLLTDDRYRDANILWSESAVRVRKTFGFLHERIYVTQGFIGATISGSSTTLGREGSDYTAAILANMLDAESVTVWKDVEGILNADPKRFPEAEKLDQISYKEAVEMSFSGAKVIHPKTIKPLHNKSIPLNVRSFINPLAEGTVIKPDAVPRKKLPVYIIKESQILITVLPRDFSFVMGENLSRIFHLFSANGIKVNLVEASAISIDVCVDDDRVKVSKILDDLREEYTVIYNENAELLTVRHYTAQSVELFTKGREILLEQRTRNSVRFVVRDKQA